MQASHNSLALWEQAVFIFSSPNSVFFLLIWMQTIVYCYIQWLQTMTVNLVQTLVYIMRFIKSSAIAQLLRESELEPRQISELQNQEKS